MGLESFSDKYIEKETIIEKIGSKFHEERRKSTKKSDGTYESRIENTTDKERISNHNGETKVDIINTKFEDLPNDWKKENIEAAQIAVDLVYEKILNREQITPEMIEEMSEIVHNEWLKRNGIAGSFENQRAEYKNLSEEEKTKDRNQIIRAIEVINGQ